MSNEYVKQDKKGKSWAYYSDPSDFSTHINSDFFNEDNNLSKQPYSIGDKLEAEILYNTSATISHNFINMIIKNFAIHEPERRFKTDEEFIEIAATKIVKYIKEYDGSILETARSANYCPSRLVAARDNFLGLNKKKKKKNNEEELYDL